ncbi:hypothetical protein DRQ36_09985 [bacterium]|nr:MAG: hypothetical protein DRQ36_09985 [bacterium]
MQINTLSYIVSAFLFWFGVRLSNPIIAYILKQCTKYEPKNIKTDPGMVIGVFERFIVITLVLLGEFSSIGWILAVKALASYQFREKEVSSEYVLVGTLASLSIALLTGLLIRAILL